MSEYSLRAVPRELEKVAGSHCEDRAFGTEAGRYRPTDRLLAFLEAP